jgi:hypothetical protein
MPSHKIPRLLQGKPAFACIHSRSVDEQPLRLVDNQYPVILKEDFQA